LFSVVAVLMLVLAACGGTDAETSKGDDTNDTSSISNVSIATFQPGIAFHSAASGIASVISDNSGLNATVRPFAGPKSWYPLMDSGDIDFGTTDFLVKYAVLGIENYDSMHKNIRTVVIGNHIPMVGLGVKESSGIDSLKDLKGKNVAFYTATPESFNPLIEVELKSVGLSWDDVNKVQVSDIGDGLEALREDRVDAAFIGDPNAGVFIELDNAVGVKGLNLADITPGKFDDFPEDLKAEMAEISPGLTPTIREGAILDEPIVTYHSPNLLTSSAKLSEDIVYEVVKTLYENYEELHPIFHWLEEWNPESMFRPDPPAPYHDGAIKYFKEIGVWTDEAEEFHKEFMEMLEE